MGVPVTTLPFIAIRCLMLKFVAIQSKGPDMTAGEAPRRCSGTGHVCQHTNEVVASAESDGGGSDGTSLFGGSAGVMVAAFKEMRRRKGDLLAPRRLQP